MTITCKANTEQIGPTFRRYLEVSHYTIEQGMWYQLRNWLVKASQWASWGDARMINLADPKLVAFLMSSDKHGNARAGRRYRYEKNTIGRRMVYPRPRKDGTRKAPYMKMMSGGANVRTRAAYRFYSRDEARKFAINHFRTRYKAVRFIGSFVGAAKKAVDRIAKGPRAGSIENDNRRLSGIIPAKAQATGSWPTVGAEVSTSYAYKHSTTAAKKVTTEASAERVENLVYTSLDRAESEIVANMEQYIARKLQQEYDRGTAALVRGG